MKITLAISTFPKTVHTYLTLFFLGNILYRNAYTTPFLPEAAHLREIAFQSLAFC